MNKAFKLSINETIIRNKINSEVLIKYFELKQALKKNDPLYQKKLNLYQPDYFYTFYIIFVPFFFLNFNIYFLWRLRKDFSFLKYSTLFMFNFFTLFVLFWFTDKWIFFEYLKKPKPYSKFMREKFMKEEKRISRTSYMRVYKIDKEINEAYNF